MNPEESLQENACIKTAQAGLNPDCLQLQLGLVPYGIAQESGS